MSSDNPSLSIALAELRQLQQTARWAEAERDALSAALRRACDDAWADGQSAYHSYLAGEAPDA